MILLESGEMYLETILILQQRNTNVRSIDISEEMNFSKICNRADELMYRCKQKGGMQYEKEWDPS